VSSSPTLHLQIGTSILTLVCGDITLQDTDVIVNAANSGLLGGGGVDGAIHRAGGPAILDECRGIRARQGGCLTGEAVITTAGRLRAKKVVHTVGPVWQGGGADEDRLLANAYRNSLSLAEEHGMKSVAFPSISTGVYGFPLERASLIAFHTVRTFLEEHPSVREVRFVTFTSDDFDVYARLFKPDAGQAKALPR